MGKVVPSGAPGGFDADSVVSSARSKTDGFKKGGKAEKAKGGCMKKGGGVMSSAAKGKKPARATGGGVFSSAHSGSPRGAAPKPY